MVLVLIAGRATQRSSQFIRWLRYGIPHPLTEALAVARLKALCAKL